MYHLQFGSWYWLCMEQNCAAVDEKPLMECTIALALARRRNSIHVAMYPSTPSILRMGLTVTGLVCPMGDIVTLFSVFSKFFLISVKATCCKVTLIIMNLSLYFSIAISFTLLESVARKRGVSDPKSLPASFAEQIRFFSQYCGGFFFRIEMSNFLFSYQEILYVCVELGKVHPQCLAVL